MCDCKGVNGRKIIAGEKKLEDSVCDGEGKFGGVGYIWKGE